MIGLSIWGKGRPLNLDEKVDLSTWRQGMASLPAERVGLSFKD